MNLFRTTIALLLLCGATQAQLSFTPVDSSVTGLTPIIEAWKAQIPAGSWLWGATALDYDGDGDGDIVLIAHDGPPICNLPSIIIRNNYVPSGVLTFSDVTATVFPSAASSLPYGNKPQPWDVDNDGDLDLLCGENGKTLINNGGVFTSNGQSTYGVERGMTIGDFNEDSLMDFYRLGKSYSRGTKKVFTCGANGVFSQVDTRLFMDDLVRDGTVSTWTDADTASLSMPSQTHGFLVGQTVNVAWTGGARSGMTVISLTGGATIKVDGGTGDVLPAAATALTCQTIADAFYSALPATVRDRWIQSVAANNAATQFNRYRGPEYIDQDINGDGLIDMLFWFEGSYMPGDTWFYVCLRQADGSLVESSAAAGLPIEGCRPLSSVDVNGDGRVDLLITPGGITKSGLWLQAADGTFGNAANPAIADKLKATAPYTPHEVWEDFDQDGDLDLALSMLRLGKGYVWENNGDGTFTERISATHWDADGMQVRSRFGHAVDFNADGLTDVLTVGRPSTAGDPGQDHSSPVICWLNASAPPDPPDPPTQSYTDLVAARDRHRNVTTISEAEVADLLAQPPSAERDAAMDILTGRLNQSSDVQEGLEPMASLKLPQHDPESMNCKRWLASINQGLAIPYPSVGTPMERIKKYEQLLYYAVSAFDHALAYKLTGNVQHANRAIEMAGMLVALNSVAGDQYLKSGSQFRDVFATLAWCPVADENRAAWIAWGKGHLGSTDGSVEKSIWWKSRWSRNNPANNYHHSFLTATSYYAIAANDKEWLAWLKQDRFPKLRAYYETTPGGGSSEGTGYGESHRTLFELAKLWRDYDRTEILPPSFAGDSILYWVHATCPGFAEIAPIGDHTRAHGRTDGYHRHLVLSALRLAGKDHPNASNARWYLANGPKIGQRFLYQYELEDHAGTQTQPSDLDHDATGVGHFFARSNWTPAANMLYVTCGPYREAHAAQDQGGFGLWCDGKWKTVTQNRWSRYGIAQRTEYQNVMWFGDSVGKTIPQKFGTSAFSVLYKRNNDLLLTCDLSPVYAGKATWQRAIEWTRDQRLALTDTFAVNGSAALQVQSPSPLTVTADGFRTETNWKTDDTTTPHLSGMRLGIAIKSGARTVIE